MRKYHGSMTQAKAPWLPGEPLRTESGGVAVDDGPGPLIALSAIGGPLGFHAQSSACTYETGLDSLSVGLPLLGSCGRFFSANRQKALTDQAVDEGEPPRGIELARKIGCPEAVSFRDEEHRRPCGSGQLDRLAVEVQEDNFCVREQSPLRLWSAPDTSREVDLGEAFQIEEVTIEYRLPAEPRFLDCLSDGRRRLYLFAHRRDQFS